MRNIFKPKKRFSFAELDLFIQMPYLVPVYLSRGGEGPFARFTEIRFFRYIIAKYLIFPILSRVPRCKDVIYNDITIWLSRKSINLWTSVRNWVLPYDDYFDSLLDSVYVTADDVSCVLGLSEKRLENFLINKTHKIDGWSDPHDGDWQPRFHIHWNNGFVDAIQCVQSGNMVVFHQPPTHRELYEKQDELQKLYQPELGRPVQNVLPGKDRSGNRIDENLPERFKSFRKRETLQFDASKLLDKLNNENQT